MGYLGCTVPVKPFPTYLVRSWLRHGDLGEVQLAAGALQQNVVRQETRQRGAA